MRHNFYPLALISFCALLTFGSCSKDEITTAQENQITLNGHKLNISIQEEAFEAEKPVSRNTQPEKTDTVDLGNGLYAEVSVEPDTEAPAPAKTRAAMSDGHYTIYAVDASNNRLPDELSGTMVAGQFIPDQNKAIQLTPGTYTFMCFNDAVEDRGNKLIVNNGKVNPMIGKTTKTISGGDDEVSFVMKHLSARVRFEITTYTAYPENLKGDIYGSLFNLGPMDYDIKGNFIIRGAGGVYTAGVDINKVGNDPFSPVVKGFLSKSGYDYCLPAPRTWYIPQITGKVHGKTIIAHPNTAPPYDLEANHSYLVRMRLKTKDPLYLYQDGTVGYIGDKTAERQPIALVVTEKTATEKGMAVALKDANNGQKYFLGEGYYTYHLKSDDDPTTNNMKGYEYTWTTNYYDNSASGWRNITIPPAENDPAHPGSNYPAYMAAGHYTPEPATTGANIGKWFLPSAGQWKLVLAKFGGLNAAAVPSNFWGDASWKQYFVETTDPTWDGTKAQTYFTQAGGTLPFDTYCVSGAVGGSSLYLGLSATNISYGSNIFIMGGAYGLVRPFVYF